MRNTTDSTDSTDTNTITTATVTVEFMPEWLQASHEAAGYDSIEWCGRYPANGAERVEVEANEADELLEQYGPWARVVAAKKR